MIVSSNSIYVLSPIKHSTTHMQRIPQEWYWCSPTHLVVLYTWLPSIFVPVRWSLYLCTHATVHVRHGGYCIRLTTAFIAADPSLYPDLTNPPPHPFLPSLNLIHTTDPNTHADCKIPTSASLGPLALKKWLTALPPVVNSMVQFIAAVYPFFAGSDAYLVVSPSQDDLHRGRSGCNQ